MIEVILDASQLEVFEACPRKWYLDHIRNLTTKRSNSALSTGSYYHEVLKHYYSGPLKPRSDNIGPTIRFAERLAIATSLTPDLEAAGVRSVNWLDVRKDPKFYLDRLRSYLVTHMLEDDNSEVIAVEQGFSTLLYEDTERRYILEGMIDLVSMEKHTGLTVTDHKTQSRFYEKYPYNHQLLNYMSFTKANYFRYNFIGLQDKQNENTFRRVIFKPPEGVLEQWRNDVLRTFEQMEQYLRTLPSLHTESEAFPRRRQACHSQFGTCQFHQICETPDNHIYLPNVMTRYKEKENKWRAWS